MQKDGKKFDFTPIGVLIKKERMRRKLTREQAAYMLQIEARYLANIENKGQHPSLEVFSRLVSTFDISVDQFFLQSKKHDIASSTQVSHLLKSLETLSMEDIELLQYLVDGMITRNGSSNQ